MQGHPGRPRPPTPVCGGRHGLKRNGCRSVLTQDLAGFAECDRDQLPGSTAIHGVGSHRRDSARRRDRDRRAVGYPGQPSDHVATLPRVSGGDCPPGGQDPHQCAVGVPAGGVDFPAVLVTRYRGCCGWPGAADRGAVHAKAPPGTASRQRARRWRRCGWLPAASVPCRRRSCRAASRYVAVYRSPRPGQSRAAAGPPTAPRAHPGGERDHPRADPCGGRHFQVREQAVQHSVSPVSMAARARSVSVMASAQRPCRRAIAASISRAAPRRILCTICLTCGQPYWR